MRRFAKLQPRWYVETLGRSIRGKADLQALVPYLMAGPHTNAIGLYRLPLHYVVGDLGWDEERVKAAIAELVSLEFCRHDPESEVIWIVDGFRNEFERDLERDPTKREPRQIPMVAGLVAEVRESPLADEFIDRYRAEYPVLLSRIEASPKVAPSEGQCSPKLAPSLGQGSPKLAPNEGQGSPKLAPSEGQGSPKLAPSEGQCSPKVAPSEGQGSPKLAPSLGQGSPKLAPNEGQGSPKLAPSLGLPRARAGSGSGSGSGLVSGYSSLSDPNSQISNSFSLSDSGREGRGERARAREERLPTLAPVLSATERDSLASLMADPGGVDPVVHKSPKLTDRKAMALERRHLLAALKIRTDPEVARLAGVAGGADDAFELWVEWRRRRWTKHRKESNPCRSEVPALRKLLEPGHEPAEILRALRVAGENSWKGFKWEWVDKVPDGGRRRPPGVTGAAGHLPADTHEEVAL